MKPASALAKSTGKTLADFRAKHDRDVVIPNKIREGIAKLLEGGAENHEYESDFMRIAGVSQTDISKYRDQFADFICFGVTEIGKKNPRNVWFATAKAAKAARGE